MRAGNSNSETTLPAEQTSADSDEQKVLSLIWLFPEPVIQYLQQPRYVIGRDRDCEVCLDSPSVSRKHAEIYRDGPIFAVRDLSSRNGTYLNGQRLTHAALREGQVIRIGEFVGILMMLVPHRTRAASFFEEIAPGLFGGPRVAELVEPLRRAAAHDLPVIIQSETGTGKELIARSIHGFSQRSGPFYAVNCAALPAAMVDGELFGYRKGAFTGATNSHVGHIRAADGGTLFLDEIIELPLDVQAKLLRVLQEREVLPLGENRAQPIDVRIVCACQTSLRDAVQRGQFRADLHARLAGYVCKLPALRERREDIPGLFAAFARRFSGGRPPAVEAKLIEQLCLYNWPDNVRELELLTKRLLVLHGHEPLLKRSFLPDHLTTAAPLEAASDDSDNLAEDRKTYELKRLITALRSTNGNLTKAVALLGISRQRAYRIMGGRSVEHLLEHGLEYGAGTE